MQLIEEGIDRSLIAGWGQEEDKRRAHEAGFDQHLTKPAYHESIESVLAKLERSEV